MRLFFFYIFTTGKHRIKKCPNKKTITFIKRNI